MPSLFPTAQPSAKTDFDPNTLVASSFQNAQGEDINAIAAKVGHGDANNAPALNKMLKGTASGKSEWSIDFKDEDNMASDSATAVPTQQSVKAYVDSGTVTMTNKTLTSPIISTISNTGTLTLPTSTDTLVGRATTDTMTNKTLTSPTINTPTVTGGTITSSSIVPLNSDGGSSDFAMDVTPQAALTIANNATANPFSNTNNFSGLILITDVSNGASALFLVGGTPVVLVSQTTAGAPFSATKDTASKTNVYYDTTAIFIQNKTGADHQYYVMAFRTRAQL